MSGRSAEFNRDAVITIQGGGIYGLFLIGQLEYLIQDLKIKPLAYAGTSAGAILATLSWAGYSPRQIRGLFESKAASTEGIVSLLGPFTTTNGLDAFEFSHLGCLAERLQNLAPKIPILIKAIEPLKDWDKKSIWNKFRILWTLHRDLDVDQLTSAFQDGQTVLRLANSLGCFPGEALEAQVEEWLLASPLFTDYSLREGQDRLTFRDARLASIEHPVPPLFLAATNLSSRSLELISSIKDEGDEYDYDDVPIAAAVRASAAVPGFFRPVRVSINNNNVSLVDGGWISNYPMWVFSRDLRARLLRMSAHQILGSKPWINVGLRLFRKSKPTSGNIDTFREFADAAFEIGTGGARSEMDDRAAPQDARLRAVWQDDDDADAVKDFLDLNSFDVNLVRGCFTAGREAAESCLGNMSLNLPPANRIEPLLEKLVEFAGDIFQAASPGLDIKARSNVFLPLGNEFHMAYRANMDGEMDLDRDLSFADTKSGLSGFAFTRRRTMICNLQRIGELQRSGKLSPQELFGMDKRLGGQVREDRTWLASVPIFDPLGIVPERWNDGTLDNKGAYYFELPPSIDGPVFGALNLDACIPYELAETGQVGLDPDVLNHKHWTDVRVRSIIARMEQIAMQLGQCFSTSFGQIQKDD